MADAFRIRRGWRTGVGAALFLLVGSAALGQGRDVRSAEAMKAALARRSGLSLEVRTAVLLAHRQLERPECRQIFLDFRDSSGRPLQERLDSLERTGQSYLAEMIFYDGSHRPSCKRPEVLATTVPGHRVIFICGQKFKVLFRQKLLQLSTAILHEELHSLGLGENPPSSEEITRRVARRCQ